MDLITDNKELKRIVKQRLQDNRLSLQEICRRHNMGHDILFNWMNESKFEGHYQNSILKLARVLAIEVKLTIRLHPESLIDKDKYGIKDAK